MSLKLTEEERKLYFLRLMHLGASRAEARRASRRKDLSPDVARESIARMQKADLNPVVDVPVHAVSLGAVLPDSRAHLPSRAKPKTVLFSFKIAEQDLADLRLISERDCESVSLLVRQAIKQFLASKKDLGL